MLEDYLDIVFIFINKDIEAFQTYDIDLCIFYFRTLEYILIMSYMYH